MADDSAKTIDKGEDPKPSGPPDKSDTTRMDEQPAAPTGGAQPFRATASLSGTVPQKPVAERKKETSRIPLDIVQEQPGPVAGRRVTIPLPLADMRTPLAPPPETIRLKRPPSVTPQIRIGLDQAKIKAATDRINLGEAPTILKKDMAKHQTSRIILLDEAPWREAPEEGKRKTSPLDDSMRTPVAPPPETIRLKRPFVAIANEETALATDVRQKVETARKSETAKIDLPKETVVPVPMTQRKTIKIKRTERNVVPRTVTITRPGAAAAKEAKEGAKQVNEAVTEQAAGEDVAEDAGLLFSVAAAAAVLIVGGLVYIMAAQALAPDVILPLPSILAL